MCTFNADSHLAKHALPVSQPIAPIMTRINAVKAQFADVDKIKYKLEAKDEDIRELRKQLKLKVSECC